MGMIVTSGIATVGNSCHSTQSLSGPGGGSAATRFRVLVEKSTHRLTVFDGDQAVKVYHICTGSAAGDKQVEGDMKTPLGDFYVCLKNPESKFTLSLGLSYPNQEDAQRGLREGLINQAQYDAIVSALARKAQPPWDTPLGGEIMIHGAGAWRDGTAGCVGMEDDDIRQLYAMLPLGTPVKIVP